MMIATSHNYHWLLAIEPELGSGVEQVAVAYVDMLTNESGQALLREQFSHLPGRS